MAIKDISFSLGFCYYQFLDFVCENLDLIRELRIQRNYEKEYNKVAKKIDYYEGKCEEYFLKSSFEHHNCMRKERLVRRCRNYELKLNKAEILLQAMEATKDTGSRSVENER